MAPDGSPARKKLAESAMVRSAIGSGRHTMKKGPWTALEDAVLTDYVKRHGEGNWNAVQRNSGLMRCGKSCRLRWANHLRPNLKKGAFSADEENLIVQLHAKYGNKWARMASQLPGRTDNEIKNYWNTRLKRRQRAGLPIYPIEIRPNQNLMDFPPTNIHPSSASIAALLSPPPPPPAGRLQKSDFSAPMSVYDMFTSSAVAPPPPPPPPPRNNFPSSSSYLSRHGLALSLSPSVNSSSSPFSPPSSSSLPYSSNNSLNFGMSQMPYNLLNLGITQYSDNSRPFFQGLPSIQSVLGHTNRRYPAATASSGVIQSSSSGGDDPVNQDELLEGFCQSNSRSGLLEDLFGESLTRAKKAADSKIEAEEDDQANANANAKFLWDYKLMEDANEDDDSPTHRLKRIKVSTEDGSLEDEDLVSSLLDNSPLAIQMPELYDDYGNVSNTEWPESSGVEKEVRQEYSDPPLAAADGASSSWKILPETY